MESMKKMNLSSFEDKLSIYEMEEVQAGKMSANAFCVGVATVDAVVGGYGLFFGPVGAITTGILWGVSAGCAVYGVSQL